MSRHSNCVVAASITLLSLWSGATSALDGRVVDLNGQPLPQAMVTLTKEAGQPGPSAVTAASVNATCTASGNPRGAAHHSSAAIASGAPSHTPSRAGRRRASRRLSVAIVSTIAARTATATSSPTMPGALPS